MATPTDFDAEAHAQRLREELKPSPRFLEVVEELGRKIGLDPTKIAAGEGIEIDGVAFWLANHGARDPEGLYLMVHAGEIPPENEAQVLRSLLVHNATLPAARSGYYCVLPGTESAAFCVRFDVATTPLVCEAILAFVAMIGVQMESATSMLAAAADEMVKHDIHAMAQSLRDRAQPGPGQ